MKATKLLETYSTDKNLANFARTLTLENPVKLFNTFLNSDSALIDLLGCALRLNKASFQMPQLRT